MYPVEVQRLITKQRLQRKRKAKAETLKGIKATREARKDWVGRVAQFNADRKAKRAQEVTAGRLRCSLRRHWF